MKNLKKWIKTELIPEGKWYGDGYIKFIESAEKMLKSGMSEDEIKEILSDLYWAISEEFGA